MISSTTWKIGTTGVIPYTTPYEKAQQDVGLFYLKKYIKIKAIVSIF
jgi:hypothetical protein